MRRSLAEVFREESAATIVEYAIVAALVSVVAIAALLAIGTNVGAIYGNGQLNH